MSEMNQNLFIDENGVVSLEIEEDYDLDLALKLNIKTSNNLKLEIKYPNLNRLNVSFLRENGYLKQIYLNIRPSKSRSNNLCNSVLGLYPNLAYDSISKEHKIIIQGFVPNKPLFKQETLKIGDLIISINNTDVNSSNIESILSNIQKPTRIKVVALSPITYANLNTNDQILNSYTSDLTSKEKKSKIISQSKAIKVVKGDRAKANNQNLISNDDFFMYAMILSLDQGTLKRKQSLKDNKNDLVYKYPNNATQFGYKKQNSILLIQLIEQIRGLFMTLSYAIKDINKDDEAVCSTIEYQNEQFNVCFLSENYGNKGQLVLIVPSNKINLNYLKQISKNLNQTFKFLFKNSLNDLLSKNENDLTSSPIHSNLNESYNLKNQLDIFFNNFHKRLITSSLFKLFDMDQNIQEQNLNALNRFRIYSDMKLAYFDSIPFYELPINLKNRLESALSEIESQEFVDLESNNYKFKRHFFVIGSCIYYQSTLLATHLNESTNKNIFNYCTHYDLFNLIRNGNTNQFNIWKEIELDHKENSLIRHFLIIVGLKEFMTCLVLETGGLMSRAYDRTKIIESNPVFIQKISFMLYDLDKTGLMDQINKYFQFGYSQIIFNLDKYLTLPKKKSKTTNKKRSNTRSPLRIKIDKIATRSRSINERDGSLNRCSPSPSRGLALENSEVSENEENEIQELPINEDLYHSKKLSRYSSIKELNKEKEFLNTLESEQRYFADLSLNNSVIYYASTDSRTNGILFTPKRYNLNSNLFTRFFYNYIQTCFKIKSLFDSFKFLDFESKDKNYEVLEQGILFKLLVEDSLKNKNTDRSGKLDKNKMKEFNFWVVGRRKYQRVNQNSSEWQSMGDFYICFHDSLEDILIEMAFDIGFSKLNF